MSLAISLAASTIPLIIAWTFFFKLGGRAPIIYNFDLAGLRPRPDKVPFGFLLDSTSLVMFVIVATISWMVQIYSIGYIMNPDFCAFMLTCPSSPCPCSRFYFQRPAAPVLSWEPLGLCSSSSSASGMINRRLRRRQESFRGHPHRGLRFLHGLVFLYFYGA